MHDTFRYVLLRFYICVHIYILYMYSDYCGRRGARHTSCTYTVPTQPWSRASSSGSRASTRSVHRTTCVSTRKADRAWVPARPKRLVGEAGRSSGQPEACSGAESSLRRASWPQPVPACFWHGAAPPGRRAAPARAPAPRQARTSAPPRAPGQRRGRAVGRAPLPPRAWQHGCNVHALCTRCICSV